MIYNILQPEVLCDA